MYKNLTMKYSKLAELYEDLDSTSSQLEKTKILADFFKKLKTDELQEVVILVRGKVFPDYDSRVLGMASRLAIKAISKTTGTSPEKVEKKWKEIGDLGEVAQKLTKSKKQSTLFKEELTINKVLKNFRTLADLEGAGTVNKKISLVSELLSAADSKSAKYIIRTVLEELRIGVGTGIIRDAISKAFEVDKDLVEYAYNLTTDFSEVIKLAKEKGDSGLKKASITIGKPIRVMLYQKTKDLEDAFKIVGKPAALEYKYDGFRCVTGRTPIYVKSKGLISVKDVKVGDSVLTHTGKFKKIMAINSRTIDPYEKLFELQSYFGNIFRITEKHPILIKRNTKKQWTNVEDLSKDDMLFFPKLKISTKLPKEIILKDASGYSKRIILDNKFFRFIGYWIGDGFTNNYRSNERIGLVFNAKKERTIPNYYKFIISELFRVEKIAEYEHNGALNLYWRDRPFRQWLTKHFRHDNKHGKTLPTWFLGLNKYQFEEFLKGWIESDGYVDNQNRTVIITKEKTLAMFAQLLGLKFGRIIGVKKIRTKCKNCKYTYYRLIIPKSKRAYSIEEDGVLLKIKNIREIKPDPRTKIYNLQVEDDESYCTTMATLHNCQIHRDKDKVVLFTRRLENVTNQFPDIVKVARHNIKSKEYVVDCEIIGIDPKTKKWLPFQRISQRIKRKYDIQKIIKEIPLQINIFDILYLNGKSLISEPFQARREKLQKIVKEKKDKIVLAEEIITSDLKEAEKFYKKSLAKGNEGVMAKNLEARYKPGSRVGYGVKIKPIMESLDLVIVGADWGTGKRANWMSSFKLACIDPNTDKFLSIGKMGTGIKEKEEQGLTFKQLTKLLKKHIISEKGKSVKLKPKIVLEVAYEEIQKSPTYSSGYALRFPRLIRLRDDRLPEEADTLERIKELYKNQRMRK